MQELISAITAATASGASVEQKAAGVQACRTIIAALDTEPGKPLVPPFAQPQSPLAGISIDQVLDLAVARLTAIATAREVTPAPSPAAPTALRIPTVAPVTPSARSATRPTIIKRPNIATRKP